MWTVRRLVPNPPRLTGKALQTNPQKILLNANAPEYTLIITYDVLSSTQNALELRVL